MITVLVDPGSRKGISSETLEHAVSAACGSLGATEGEVSVALVDDRAIADLNLVHLGCEGPTDVIAFALFEAGEPVVGDVYVGVEQAVRQAEEAGVTLEEELVRLVVHGTLHVLGLDHPDEAGARPASPMYVRQEALVREVLGAQRGSLNRDEQG
jgi:probable rRNA maturation factor